MFHRFRISAPMSSARIAFLFCLGGISLGVLISEFPSAKVHSQSDPSVNNAVPVPNIDSLLQALVDADSLVAFHQFAVCFPETATHPKYLSARRKFFQQVEKVVASGLNVDSLLLRNPCYYPLYVNIDYRNNRHVEYHELFNDSLAEHPFFGGRYVMGEFNTIMADGSSKGVKEHLPNSQEIDEFFEAMNFAASHGIVPDSLWTMDEKIFADLLLNEADSVVIFKSYILMQNYYQQVAKYQKQIVETQYNYIWRYQYHTGQHLCMCEAKEDTIYMIARFATSAKAWTKPMNRHLPVGLSRSYYAPINTLASRNWEWGRRYGELERARDKEMKGGSAHVTIYEGAIQLPNFMRIDPIPAYKDAMWQNGIHTQALPYLVGGMLGTPNSMGCLRVTDYASRFVRWWVPTHAKLFIYYTDDNYFKVEQLDYTPEKKPS